MRFGPIIGILAVGCWSCAANLTAEEPPQPKFSWKLSRPQDQKMETVLSKDTVVFTLDDSRNLGYGDVELKEGQWPQHVVLRLLKFRGLEGLNIEVNQVQFEVNLPHSDDKTTINFDDQGKRTDQSDKAVYHVHVRRVKEPTAIEVEIPKELLPAQGKSLSFHWTDFYRR